ncbi:MAG: glycosyltransferase, partial [Bellilinea sp.]
HLQFSADINASCPNSVVEALACGLPVAAFDSGALAELVQGDAGVVVAYGANPWKLEKPDFPALAQASLRVLAEQDRYRRSARALAEERFSLEKMTAGYLQALQK